MVKKTKWTWDKWFTFFGVLISLGMLLLMYSQTQIMKASLNSTQQQQVIIKQQVDEISAKLGKFQELIVEKGTFKEIQVGECLPGEKVLTRVVISGNEFVTCE
jgi:hypothetical protein